MFARNLEDVVGLLAIFAVGVVVDEGVVLVDDGAVAFFLLLVHALLSLAEARLENEHLKVFLVLAVGVVLDGVLGGDDGALVVVAHVIAQVVIERGIFQFLLHQLVLQFKDGALCNRHLVALGEVVEKRLQLLDGLYRLALVELRVGRIQVVTITGIEARQLGILASGVLGIVLLEVGTRIQVILVLIVAEAQQVERLLGLFGAAEHGDHIFEQRVSLGVFLLLKSFFGELKLVVVV